MSHSSLLRIRLPRLSPKMCPWLLRQKLVKISEIHWHCWKKIDFRSERLKEYLPIPTPIEPVSTSSFSFQWTPMNIYKYLHGLLRNSQKIFHDDQDNNNNSSMFDVSRKDDIYSLMQWIQFMKYASNAYLWSSQTWTPHSNVFSVNLMLDMDLSTYVTCPKGYYWTFSSRLKLKWNWD